ncbi:hypothetical protein ABMA09_10240 [Erwinia rhapontici]|uniref:Uncharacterized protein n=1 Tax=Erwinia rhapontici TaxID=55212 RepID=A0ABN6DIZ7_ERWRD|nr:hypothetical protein ERHA53_19640 [Erwinia rhapontici]
MEAFQQITKCLSIDALSVGIFCSGAVSLEHN